MTASRALLAHAAPLWPRVIGHPFVQAVCDGELSADGLARWVVNDFHYNVGYLRFLAGLVTIAPTPHATEVMASGLVANQVGYDRLKLLAERHEIDLDTEPAPTTLGFSAFLQAQLTRGWDVALASLYASERVYFDAWSSIRPVADRSTSYWSLVESWSDEDFADWLGDLAGLVDTAAMNGNGPSREALLAFERVVRFELQFWSAVYAGETW